MKFHMQAPQEVHLSKLLDDDFDVSSEKPPYRFTAISMWVASLGRCTFAVLDHYAMRMDLDPNEIIMQMRWEFGSEPTTISKIDLDIYWPELPEKRIQSVQRASHKCTIHTTIKECVEINVAVYNREPSAD